jgi:hypothetical protein
VQFVLDAITSSSRHRQDRRKYGGAVFSPRLRSISKMAGSSSRTTAVLAFRKGRWFDRYRTLRQNCDMSNSDLLKELRGRELRGGGWSFFGSQQVSLEATSLASLCLLAERPSEALRLGTLLSGVQLVDGSWPSFVGDRESSWTTALAVCALNSVNDPSKARERGESWLLRTKGGEGHWLWRWKFKTADRNVQFDPDKYGWPWISGPPQAGSSPQPSASSPSSNSRSAIAPRNRRNASIWVSRCFWTAHVLTAGGIPETALFTECRCAPMLRPRRSRCWLSRTNSEPK